METIRIEEVIRRVPYDSGVLEPFFCRCSDGFRYYVKGKYAGPNEMICELICAELGKRLGIAIPEFRLAKIPDGINWHDLHPESADIGSGVVFASREVENARVFQLSEVPKKAVDNQADDILLFDWWIRNGDRSRTNPNLLFANGKIHVIDHNLAFTGNETLAEFLQNHIFGNRVGLFGLEQEKNAGRLDAVLREWREICDVVPSEWLESCYEGDIILNGIFEVLTRYKTEPQKFWIP